MGTSPSTPACCPASWLGISPPAPGCNLESAPGAQGPGGRCRGSSCGLQPWPGPPAAWLPGSPRTGEGSEPSREAGHGLDDIPTSGCRVCTDPLGTGPKNAEMFSCSCFHLCLSTGRLFRLSDGLCLLPEVGPIPLHTPLNLRGSEPCSRPQALCGSILILQGLT